MTEHPVSRKTRKDDSVERNEEGLPWWRRPGRSAVLSLLALTGLVALAVTGLERLKGHVETLPQYNPTPRLQLMDTPDWVDREQWRPQILASIRLPEQPDWLGGGVVREVGEQLASSGWVSKVKRVLPEVDGTIRIWCDYRRPIAMIRIKSDDKDGYTYVAIDKDGVRLPQVYREVEEAGWMQIVGVEIQEPPPPGQVFPGEDAAAAVRLAELIFRQDFAHRISVIDVTNFRGRKSKRQDHIFLLARGRHEPLIWGSAIGEEFDENHWQDKIRLISLQLKNGSPHVQANVSCFPDRVILKVEPTIQTADSSKARGR
jgi:hypothetical protein